MQQSTLRLLFCCCVILFSASSLECSSSSPRTTTQGNIEVSEEHDGGDTEAPLNEVNPAINRHAVLSGIMELMGIPYIITGIDNTGFDCSGFTVKIYRDLIGKALPHSTQDQFSLGKAVKRRQLKFGDLVFFRTGNASPSHVGIYVGDGLFAHASTSLGVTISLLGGTYYKQRYVGARRIVE